MLAVEETLNASFGGISALSKCVVVSSSKAAAQEHLPIILVGMCSRILAWDVARGCVVGSCTALPHGIRVHGISFSQSGVDDYHVVAHGGRCLTLLRMRIVTGKVEFSVVEHVTGVEKWILDVACHMVGEGQLCVAVGKIDNSVSLYCFQGGLIRKMKECVGDVRCLLYSMSITMVVVPEDGRDVYEWRVAAGTILWDVEVWCIQACDFSLVEDIEQHSMYRCTGHKGSIHSVVWSVDGCMLASGSDDRVVKIWHIDRHKEVQEGVIAIDLLGSRSRIWALCFSCDGTCVWSGAEDGCIYWWDISLCSRGDTKIVDTNFKAHAFRGVWNLVMYQHMLISGGADGGLKVWNACDHVPHVRARQWLPPGARVRELCERLDTYLIPAFVGREDGLVARFQMRTGDCMPLRLQDDRLETWLAEADGMRKQAIIDDIFETIKVIRLVGNMVYVGTDLGRVVRFVMSQTSMTKDSFDSALEGSLIYQTDRNRPIISLESYRSRMLAFCDVDGRVYIVNVEHHSGGTLPVQEAVYTCASRVVHAFFVEIDKSSHILCTTAQGTVFLFSIHEKGRDCQMIAQVDCPNKDRITAVAAVDSHIGSIVVLGSSKGGISGFIVQHGRVLAVASQRFAHDRTPVQYVHVEHHDGNVFRVETGACNFGIQHYILKYDSGALRIEMKNEQRFEPVKVICGRMSSPRAVLVGFYTNNFVVWDITLSSEFCNIYCPSWRRPWDFHYDASQSQVMFCYSSGVGDLHVFTKTLRSNGCSTCPRILGTSGHGREINSVVDLGDGTLVTAAEDATLRVCRWVDHSGNIILHSACFSTQPLGTTVRTIQVIKINQGNTLMVTGGAKTVLTAWAYSTGDQKPRHLSTFVDTNALKTEKTRDKSGFGDIRVTSLCLIPSNRTYAEAFVVAAQSNGVVELRYIPCVLPDSTNIHEWPLVGIVSAPTDMVRPTILSLIHMGDTIVCGGDTNGNLLFWNIQNSGSIQPLAFYPGIHTAGVNCMTLTHQSSTSACLISGGDDQSLCISQVDWTPDSLKLNVIQSIPNAHASAIRDVCIHNDDTILSIGLDQYMRTWTEEAGKFKHTHSTHTQVLEPISMTPSSSNITIAGRGIETLSLM